MRKIRYAILVVCLVLGMSVVANAQVSIGIGLPGVSIGINLPVYPRLAMIPGYPVYYAPAVNANYFFYDGMYWVFYGDNWYASSWYNGPWGLVAPEVVPLYVLRIPVRYYRAPPPFFRGWPVAAPPRWDLHWGPQWSQHRTGWNTFNRRVVPRPAPLPTYQRRYPSRLYPQVQQQPVLRNQYYQYSPRTPVVREHYHSNKWAPPAPRRR